MSNEKTHEQMVWKKDYPIGAKMIFDEDHLLQVAMVKNAVARCDGCFFNHNTDGLCVGVMCLTLQRADGKDVIYKKIS